MASKVEQTRLISLIDEANGFSFEPYLSASGIDSNFKIDLDEGVVDKKPCLRGALVSAIVKEILSETTEIKVVVATGGATYLADEIAFATGWRSVEIVADKGSDGRKEFYIKDEDKGIFYQNGSSKDKKVAFIEDVSSTFDTARRAAEQTGIQDDIRLCVSGWRRGRPAPLGTSTDWIIEHNKRNKQNIPFEVDLPFPSKSVIERGVPLWIQGPEAIDRFLPEITVQAVQQPTGTDRPFVQSLSTANN